MIKIDDECGSGAGGFGGEAARFEVAASSMGI